MRTLPANPWQGFPHWPIALPNREIIEAILPECWDAPQNCLPSVTGSRPEEINTRLIVYGSLAPGKENARYLAALKGTWYDAEAPGEIDRSGRYPRFYPRFARMEPVQVFVSTALPACFPQLDRFEGPGYRRIWWPVAMNQAWVLANLYAATG